MEECPICNAEMPGWRDQAVVTHLTKTHAKVMKTGFLPQHLIDAGWRTDDLQFSCPCGKPFQISASGQCWDFWHHINFNGGLAAHFLHEALSQDRL